MIVQALRILDVSDFVLPATVMLIRSLTPGRFDPVIELLSRELKARLVSTNYA